MGIGHFFILDKTLLEMHSNSIRYKSNLKYA